MKHVLVAVSVLFAHYAIADHAAKTQYAEVTHVEPVYEDIAYDQAREHCWDETVSYEHRRDTAAPLLGAILGGVIGHQVGHGSSNKKIGAFVGAGLGAAVGSQAARGDRHYHIEQRCETVYDTHWRKELIGYDVTYRYHGIKYETRLPEDPGERIRVHVSVTPAS